MIIGLTGGIASGKTLVSDQLEALGAKVIDTDVVAREVLAPGTEGLAAVLAAFGAAVLTPEGALDRRALRAQVFQDPAARLLLENITHPRIRAQVQARIAQPTAGAQPNSSYSLVVVPLMAEAGRYAFLDAVVVVDCSVAVQRQRLMQRDQITPELAEQMLAAQASRAQRLALADHVISNDAQPVALAPVLAALHARFCRALR